MREFYTVSEVAKKTGLCYRTVLEKVKNGDIPSCKVGDGRRFLIPASYLDDMRTKAYEEKENGSDNNRTGDN